jgi:beta-glucanase (GH16 family)
VDDNPNGVVSRGALLYRQETYGYGTYAWRMRMSSTALSPSEPGVPVAGTVSAGFIFVNNSETEIDFEFSGQTVATPFPETLYMVNWNNQDPSTGPTDHEFTSTVTTVPGINQEFKTYQFEWKQDGITFSVDGIPQVIHRTDMPQAPAYFMINHWGADRPDGFGGKATIGVERYLYVDWVKYTPER